MLCPIIILSDIKSLTKGSILSIVGQSLTFSLVMPVNCDIKSEIGEKGFTKEENVSIILLLFTFIIPISIISSICGSNPVVSISITQ